MRKHGFDWALRKMREGCLVRRSKWRSNRLRLGYYTTGAGEEKEQLVLEHTVDGRLLRADDWPPCIESIMATDWVEA